MMASWVSFHQHSSDVPLKANLPKLDLDVVFLQFLLTSFAFSTMRLLAPYTTPNLEDRSANIFRPLTAQTGSNWLNLPGVGIALWVIGARKLLHHFSVKAHVVAAFHAYSLWHYMKALL
jgi:hypothetical protein